MTSTTGFRRTSGYFVDDIAYRRQPGVLSETVPNSAAEQAFVYGLREVLRFCVEGALSKPNGPQKTDTRHRSRRALMRHICGIGSDVEHGVWANLGGFDAIRVYLEGVAPWRISDYPWLSERYRGAIERYDSDPEGAARHLVHQLNQETGLGLYWLEPSASAARKEQS